MSELNIRKLKVETDNGRIELNKIVAENVDVKSDYQDSHRQNSPLKQADDAVLIDTSDLTIEQVVDKVMKLVKEKLGD